MARKLIKKRVQQSVLEAANIDSSGLDPEMLETLGQESARRVGAAGVGVRTKNPLEGFHTLIGRVTDRIRPKSKIKAPKK